MTSLMAATSWCLVSFLKGDPAPPNEVTEPMISVIVKTLYRTSVDSIIQDLLAGLSMWISDASDVMIQALIQDGRFIAKLMGLIEY